MQEFVKHLGADLRALPSVTAVCEPTSQTLGCRAQKCCMSDMAAFAAVNASPALTCDFGSGCEPPLGNRTRTTPNQKATRNRNRIGF